MGAIEINKLCKSFGTQQVLNDLSLSIEQGEMFILMGLSGTGKSVTLKHLLRLEMPDAGTIHIDGQDLFAMHEPQMVAYLMRTGTIFQNAALFDSMSTAENVAFPMREHTDWTEAQIEARVQDLLARVRLAGAGDKNPSALSGGMRKRAGIARGLALQPDFLYFDEPTGGLDMVTGRVIEDLILETHTEFRYTGLVITHHWELAQRLADRMALLWDGKAHFIGTPAEFETSSDPIVQGFLNRDPNVLAI